MPSRRIAEIGSLSESERRTLKGLYTSGPTAYGSVKSLTSASGLSKKKVLQFLHSNNAYTQYHIAYRKFPRLKVIAKSINEIWCMDLAQMDKLADNNDGINHLLVSVDVLSRFVRVQPMKNKSAPAAKEALMKMLQGGEQPKMIWIDDGTEFEGAFKTLCSNLSIKRYHTKTVMKAAYAERAIRSLKNLIYRYMEDSNSHRYITRLPALVKTMNTRHNRSIDMAPKDVTNRDVLRIIHMSSSAVEKPSFRIGDYVRGCAGKHYIQKRIQTPIFTRNLSNFKHCYSQPCHI